MVEMLADRPVPSRDRPCRCHQGHMLCHAVQSIRACAVFFFLSLLISFRVTVGRMIVSLVSSHHARRSTPWHDLTGSQPSPLTLTSVLDFT